MEFSKFENASCESDMNVGTASMNQTEPLTTDSELLAAADFVVDALKLFLDNKYEEAKNHVKPFIKDSIYHSAAYAFLEFANASLSHDKADIAGAIDSLTDSIAMCDARIHRWSLLDNAVMHMFISIDYNTYTEEELQSEAIKAQCSLARAMLTFLKDDSILSFVRGALYVRSAHQLYKRCYNALEHRTWTNNKLKRHFEAGVKLGLGFFNLMLSSVPKRLLMLLEFVGFSGNREVGLKFLKTGHQMQDTFSGILCSVVMFSHCNTIRYVLGNGLTDSEIDQMEDLLPIFIDKYPQSTLALFHAGRLKYMRGNVAESIKLFDRAISGPSEWTQLNQLVYMDLYYSNVSIGNYRAGIKFTDKLLKESSWSTCSFLYMKAAAMLMCDDLTSEERKEVECIMRTVPHKRLNLAGKYLPPETYFTGRAERFISEGNFLVMPAFEVMYVWNYLKCLHGKIDILEPILQKINSCLDQLREVPLKESPFYMDHYCMALLLKGLCLTLMLKPKLAKKLFLEILSNQEEINEDHYIVSCASMEIGFIYYNDKQYEKSAKYFEKAKINATFYAEFRIHEALEHIELAKRNTAASITKL